MQAKKTIVGKGDQVGTAARLGSHSTNKGIKDYSLQKADDM